MAVMTQAINEEDTSTRPSKLKAIKSDSSRVNFPNQQIVRDFPKVIFQTDKNGHYTYLNQSWEDLTGIPVEQALGKHYKVFLNRRQNEIVNAQFEDSGKTKTAIIEYDFKGNTVWYEISMSLLLNADKEVVGYFGCFNDVTYLKTVEMDLLEKNELLNTQQKLIESQVESLSQKNKELQKYIETNLELENFAYIASHDLKAPLRTVMSFSQLMKKNHYTCLDAKGQGYLDIITDASKDMIYLIDDLLKYSDISTSELNLATTDLAQIVSEVYINVHPKLNQIGAVLAVDDLPTNCIIDKQKIYRLVKLLFENCIKFKSQHPLRIKISSEELRDHWVIKISDNGVGIDPQFVDKAFELFQKQQTNDSRSGTGIGLTIARAIVRLHDGEIWIDSTKGKGTDVSFTLSKNLKQVNL